MRPDEGNLLDLNKVPEDHYRRDGKQVVDGSSSVAGSSRKRKNSAKDGNDGSGKVYECRFCSAKFCKSQALGGHMKCHRQERETELLNWARQLVFNNGNLAVTPLHLGRPDEGNLLDLNKVPEDHYGRDGKQVVDGSSSAPEKKKNSAEDGKDESGKVYECRFCSIKFRKSQVLGGHMKCHRQERETEQLNWARQLVSNNDNLAVAPHHLGF